DAAKGAGPPLGVPATQRPQPPRGRDPAEDRVPLPLLRPSARRATSSDSAYPLDSASASPSPPAHHISGGATRSSHGYIESSATVEGSGSPRPRRPSTRIRRQATNVVPTSSVRALGT